MKNSELKTKEIILNTEKGLQYKIKGDTITLEMVGELCSISVSNGEVEVSSRHDHLDIVTW